MRRRIGIDVGGTNTDAVLLEDDTVAAAVKTPTTPDVTTGITRALAALVERAPGARDADAAMIGTTHFTNAVVPIITAWAARAPGACATSAARARVMPVVTSGVVGVFTPAATASSSSRTASVLVPPTSMPMRRLTRTPNGSRGRSRRRGAPRARSPSG